MDFCFFMILYITILCGPFYAIALSNPIGNCWVITQTGEINAEGIENYIL